MDRDKLKFTEGNEKGIEELERAKELIIEAADAISKLHYGAGDKSPHDIITEAHTIVLDAFTKVGNHQRAERDKCFQAWREALGL